MPATKIREFLDRANIPYTTILHPPAFTAQKTAAVAHVPGREVAKTVVVKVDDQLALAVLPADLNLDLEHLRSILGADSVELASEWEFKDRFPDCEAGAMPPFGNLYDMPVYVADALAEDEFIAFNAGNHREMIRMRYADFARLVKPRVLDITWHRV
ncbi:MAG: deacylase [Verrucomicrobia bacterium]|nr:MAG: deacylase [Verrucomicrobiota bacterium]